MTLHPHVPHELKDFGKHLFATFLGLLMALALEQWREHRHAEKVAHLALVTLEAELRDDTSRIDRSLTRCQESIHTMDVLDTYVEKVMEAKRAHGPLPKLPELTDTGVPSAYATDAWETFKAAGALGHIAPDRARRLSRAYLCLSAFHTNLNSNPIFHQVPASLFLALEKPEQIQSLNIPRLKQLQEGVRLLRIFFGWCKNEIGWMRSACEVALKP